MQDMRSGVCALCGHDEVVACPASSRGYKSSYNRVVAAVVDPGFFSFNREVGAVTLYACRKCGFAQTFVEAPEAIPIGEAHGTKLVSGAKRSE